MQIRHHAKAFLFKCVLTCAATGSLTPNASAQNAASASSAQFRDAADSANRARDLYREARDAMARKDTAAALRNLAEAAQVWAAQPAYSNALLDLAIRAGNESRAIEAMRIANGMGYALPSTEQHTLSQKFQSPEFRALLSAQTALRAPLNRSNVFRTLRDSTLFPEGLVVDSRNGNLYVSSIYYRNVLTIDGNGHERWFIQDPRRELVALFGVAVDSSRNLLWVSSASNAAMRETDANGMEGSSLSSEWQMRPSAGDVRVADARVTDAHIIDARVTQDATTIAGYSSDAPSQSIQAIRDTTQLAALFAVRLSDGVIVKRVYVPRSVANPSPGDIALMNNGDVLMSDSQAGVLWWLKSGSDTLIGIRHRLLRSPQGIVPARDGRSAIVADYSHGLLRVDLESQAVVRVRDASGHSTVGIDGLVQAGNKFIAVQNGFSPAQVLRLELNADWTRVITHETIDRNTLAPSPTGGAMINGAFVYIANSLWEMLDANGKVDSKAKLPRPLLLSLPILIGK